MAASMTIVLVFSAVVQTFAQEYEICPTGYYGLADAAACETAGESGWLSNANWIGTGSISYYPPGCIVNPLNGNHVYNVHPTGGANAVISIVCQVATPAPTAGLSVSGDPIVRINGYKVKFDLPLKTDTLLLAGYGIEVFGRADLVTPDHQSQWFSKISIVKDKELAAVIERKVIVDNDNDQALGSLSLSLLKQNSSTTILTPGSYEEGEFFVRRAGILAGHIQRETVEVNLRGFKFAVGAQVAKKFKDKGMQLKYAHLDLDLRDIHLADKGLFAELFGFVPMSKKTAQSLRSLRSA